MSNNGNQAKDKDGGEELWGVWLDYIEGEWPLELKREIEKLLVLSPDDRERCMKLETTRELIRDADEAHVPMDDRRAEKLHDRIMARLERMDNEPLRAEGALASAAAVVVKSGKVATEER